MAELVNSALAVPRQHNVAGFIQTLLQEIAGSVSGEIEGQALVKRAIWVGYQAKSSPSASDSFSVHYLALRQSGRQG